MLAVIVLIFAVREPAHPASMRRVRIPISPSQMRHLGSPYWWLVAVATVFTLARFSEAFLILRAQSTGLPLAAVPAVLVLMNMVYAVTAYPAGLLSDRIGRTAMLAAGVVVLIAADLVLAMIGSLSSTAAGVVLWGLHMGMTQGLFAAMVADNSPPELRGTAYGIFNLLTGFAMLVASIVAGAFWDAIGPAGAFIAWAACAALALLGLMVARVRIEPTKLVGLR